MNINISNIYNRYTHLLVLVTVVLMSLLSPLAAYSAITSQKPSGDGTEGSPYLIETAQHLKYLQQRKADIWREGAYYKQTADIDLEHDINFGMIGSNSVANAFKGHYDGGGFTISNYDYVWNDASTTCFGLFCFVANEASITNLVIDNARIYRDRSITSKTFKNSNNDLKFGILIGALAPYTGPASSHQPVRVENIIIRNSSITDCEGTEISCVFAGGAIGDVASTYQGSAHMNDNNYSRIQIRNIAVDVDFDFSHTTRNSNGLAAGKYTQFNIGGVIGRLRKGRLTDMPSNTFYSGQVNAPIATISPVWGASRATTAADKTVAHTHSVFAGEYITDLTDGHYAVLDSDEANQNRYFSGYYITRDDDEGVTQRYEITDVFPENKEPVYGTRPFRYDAYTAAQTFDATDSKEMARFQGVNHATYVSPDNLGTVLQMFNDYATNYPDLKQWQLDRDNNWTLIEGTSIVLSQTDDFAYHADIIDAPNTDYRVVWSDAEGNILYTDNHTAGSEPVSDYVSDRYYPLIDVTIYNADDVAIAIEHINYRTVNVIIETSDFVRFTSVDNVFDPANFVYQWTVTDNIDGSTHVLAKEKGLQMLNSTDASMYRDIKLTLYDDYDNIVAESPVVYSNISIKIGVDTSDGNVLYNATAYNGKTVIAGIKLDGTNCPNADYAWLWQVSSDPTIPSSWESTTLHSWQESIIANDSYTDRNGNTLALASIGPFDTSRYYRVCLCRLDRDDDGNYLFATDNNGNFIYKEDQNGVMQKVHLYTVIMQEVVGPKHIVFLYNKAMTQRGRDYFEATQFTGIDQRTGSEYPDGNDVNTGYDPYHAVKTLARAYEVLKQNATLGSKTSMDDNIIVVMGFYFEDKKPLWEFGKEANYNSTATITGIYGDVDYGGTLNMVADSNYPSSLGASTTFENISWTGFNSITYSLLTESNVPMSEHYLYCNRHDLVIGNNVKLYNYLEQTVANGIINDTHVTHTTIIAGTHNYGQEIIPLPTDNKVPGVTTIDIRSGNFGRIIGASRNSGNGVSKSYNIFGSPETPHRSIINIDIKHSAPKIGNYIPGDYCYENTYTHDIGLLVGGQTDGTVYTETEINVIDGYFGRFISGNISYGRNPNNAATSSRVCDYPSDSFYGSTTVNLYGGEINEFFGGSLGRFAANSSAATPQTPLCEAYFYGRSIINIKGGTIKSNIYGCGSGGVSGVGDSRYHTDDNHIPYYNSEGKLQYADFDAIGDTTLIPKFTLRNGNEISLVRAHCEVNLSGGVVLGDIFGAGYGYSFNITYDKASPLAGNLYGDAVVRMMPNELSFQENPVVKGNIYGGGQGSRNYYDASKAELGESEALRQFGALGCVYGNVNIELTAGEVHGNVYGGARGVLGFKDMASITGNSSLLVDGQVTVMGNIYGGGALADVRHHPDYADLSHSGNTKIEIAKGNIGNNIFGGGEGVYTVSGDNVTSHTTHVEGDCTVTIHGGSFIKDPYIRNENDEIVEERTFNIYGGGYKNCIVGGDTKVYTEKSLLDHNESIIGGDFTSAISDITFRRYCIYGGGFGEKTCVRGNASVEINILPVAGTLPPRGEPLTTLVKGQTFFDVAGGGYSGNVGYWANADGVAVADLETATLADYHHYVNGNVSVTIQGYPFIRKVIGGAFYASAGNTDTKLISGNVQSIYGGGLMGYVHNKAKLTVGTRLDDEHPDASTTNSTLYVVEDVFGGNDVEGIVGTTRWIDDFYNTEPTEFDGSPIFTTNVDPAADCGVEMFVYGGNIKGNVYGAGNGNYRGYFVPGWLRYTDGHESQYRQVYINGNKNAMGRVYRSRPLVGKVKMHIGGNNDTNDRVYVGGNVYGGGRSCTVGNWNAILPLEDPRRINQGGEVSINFGSHVTVNGNLYIGAQGLEYTEQATIPESENINLATFNGTTNEQLNRLGDIAYEHWYLDTDLGYYVPGFPKPGKLDGNFNLPGEHMLRAYLKNIEMNCNTQLTFYDNPYDGTGARKTWLPEHEAAKLYDATDVVFRNIFAGGQCGSMTNNTIMKATGEHDGAVYRIALTKGIKVLDKVVGGSENAVSKIYAFSPDYKQLITTDTDDNPIEPMYRVNGGMITQRALGYDLIIYNDINGGTVGRDPNEYANMHYPSPYTLSDGTQIWRHAYEENNPCIPNNETLSRSRYHLAVTKDGDNVYCYVGSHEERSAEQPAVVKLSVGCEFSPQGGSNVDDHEHHYGGIVYGGCFKSGLTMGDIVLNVTSNLLGDHISPDDASSFGEISSIRHNFGRVFGGGFGTESTVKGNTYVNLLHNFVGMNVFGGGCQGDIQGMTNVNYVGSESNSYVFGSIYGGGLSGYVGIENETKRAATVKLYSGNVAKVYAGSCMGDLYGQAKVYLSDLIADDIPSLDYTKIYPDGVYWKGSRLIAGWVYGGNDITGNIYKNYDPENDSDEYKYSTIVQVDEMNDSSGTSGSDGPGKTSPGNSGGYNGFPLIGNLYGGSNGNYDTHDGTVYTDGKILLATGYDNDTDVMEYDLTGRNVPNIDDVLLQIEGGTIINAFGGGNEATVDCTTNIVVDYSDSDQSTSDKVKARAGFSEVSDVQRAWRVINLTNLAQKREVISANDDGYVFDKNIYRLFGGNDNADMAIQPTWDLRNAYIGSVYSGGNFGRMTYFDVIDGVPTSLKLHINSMNLRAESVYGGGRVGDITPAVTPEVLADDELMEDFYGATLEITSGVIEHVYGGNDVSGFVHKGAKVMVHGAISGDVYCAGNGNHKFLYDPSLPADTKIEEAYDDTYGRYFILPKRDAYGTSAADKIMAINAYRPNIDRAFMEISGISAETPAYVRGNVYCGGNSATIIGGGEQADIRFNIGNYVVLNGVYLGSNGENLTNGTMMRDTEALNVIDLKNGGDPYLLDLYMSAVDVEALPKDFTLDPNLIGAYIGDFFVGGNNGSMLTSKNINLTFPECLTVYGKIVGGSNNANLTYKDVTHIGGLPTPVTSGEKVHLNVKCKFEPWRLHYPVDDDDRQIELLADITGIDDKLYFSAGKCSVFGGCYTSGITVGDIGVDIYSDMVAEYEASSDIGQALASVQGYSKKKRVIADGINDLNRRSFAVVGSGYGANTEVRGNVRVRMLPGSDTYNAANRIAPSAESAAENTEMTHPSVGTVFGGSVLGRVIGNITVEVRDGMVFSNLYAASETAPVYGSTQTIIGYPEYYKCNNTSVYHLDRTDKLSRAAVGDLTESDDGPTIAKTVALRDGDIISPALYRTIVDSEKSNDEFTLIDDDMPDDWDLINISIGYGGLVGPDEEYYGFGNVYGGGFVSASSSVSMAGQYTVCRFTDEYTPYEASVGYGGNSMILVWDNKANATDPLNTVHDHISIGTGRYSPVAVKKGQYLSGLYVYDGENYVARGAHMAEANVAASANQYFEVNGDGGIYGGGRKVFVEGFKDCDIAYYGYADYTPQHPKLLNTFQRFDLLTVTDCCMQLLGSTDFTTKKLDGTKYSLTRVGELSMISSIPTDQALDPGTLVEDEFKNLQHNTPRSRNYMAFFNNVHYLAAVTSSELFTGGYRGADGNFNTVGDYDGSANAQSGEDDSYVTYKTKRIDNYYANIDNVDAQIAFDQRNLGTAANMLGINNGYVLNIQGGVDKDGTDHIYYGPVTGVFEVKLMTLAPNEGGGYVYALNHHEDPNYFLETTGNFIFAGAAYTTTNEGGETNTRYSYILDDCFPMDRGWDYYTNTCNDDQEIHYWYVDGNEFYYNVTLTAYTSTSLDSKFVLNNNEQLIYLRGVEPGTRNLKVDNVIWNLSDNADSDLQNVNLGADGKYAKDYRLYVSVDDRPDAVHSTADITQKAFVAPVPRADFPGEPGSQVDALANPADALQNYDNYGDGKENFPLVGITLYDAVDNSTREYYDEHLCEPEKVTIVLTNTSNNGVDYKYVINLTIKYLLGPTITGLPEIENCALPGEYIFANAFGIKVDFDDETMAITDRNWYLVSDEYDLTADNISIPALVAGIADRTTNGVDLDDQKFDDDAQVHIPAYYYMNGWHLIYEIVANGQAFYLHPDVEQIDDFFGRAASFKNLVIHNYHRMRPWDGTSYDTDGQPKCEELKIVADANIYIEDDADMAYFFTWLKKCQSVATVENSHAINPQYAEGVKIYLMADVKLPADMTQENLIFKGLFHGNGHNIDMNGNTMFLHDNQGSFYNTGFVSSSGRELVVFGKNHGHVENCFLYSTDVAKGKIDGNDDAEDSDLVNCFRTSDLTEAESFGGLMRATLDEYKYGEIAFDLNRFYLHGRYLRGNGLTDDYDDQVKPLLDIYYDGDYRFARYSPDGEPTALRTDPTPNYHNFQGKRLGVNAENYGPITGRDATNHNTYEPIDETRALRDPDTGEVLIDDLGLALAYEPIFPTDYLFFGQDLRYDRTEEAYPHAINDDNRVYRASGFYGSKVDRGFHFNVDAQAIQPTMTAVDFTGFRDWQHGYEFTEGKKMYADQICYYTPMLDLPARSLELPEGGLRSFTTATKLRATKGETSLEPITRNLLMYVRPHESVFDGFEYDASTLESDIFGHLIYPEISDTGTPVVTTNPTRNLFHLVDREDFNCPIAITVTENTWYERMPESFSSGNNAWEGLCLPFTVQTVRGVISDPNANPIRSHGELSHFYGPYEDDDVEATSHEYWLRKFTAVDDTNLYFDRPASDEDKQCVNADGSTGNAPEETRLYHYSNTYNSDAFGNVYGDGTTHARPQYTPEGLDYVDYPMITRENPYIISFPGVRFYEFDLSGEFYTLKFPGTDVIPQRVVFNTPGETVIRVTDDEAIKVFAHRNSRGDVYSLTGTYMHKVVDDGYTAAISGERQNNFGRQNLNAVVDPFRVYLTLPASTTVPFPIKSRFIDHIGDDDGEEGDASSDLVYSIDHNELVITSVFDHNVTLPLYDIEGRLVRHLDIYTGTNRFTDLIPGYYIVDAFKFRISD